MKNKTIFVACDTSNLNQINKILKNIKTKINTTGEISIEPKLGRNRLIQFKGGAVNL